MDDDYDDKPYGIRPAPGACCPDQPNCEHCRPTCPKCCAKMNIVLWDGMRLFDCPECGYEEKMGGCRVCGKQLPEPEMTICAECFAADGHTPGVRITKKVGP